MRFRFGKLQKNCDIDVTAIDENKNTYFLPCVFLEGAIEIVDFSAIDPSRNSERLVTLTRQVNFAYSAHLRRKAEAKRQRDAISAANHWWNSMSSADKMRLVSPLRKKLPLMINALLEKNPDDIKRKHYESLIKRSELGAAKVTQRVDDKKLKKLPQYSIVHDALQGSTYSFIALAEVIYPAASRSKSYTTL